MESVFIRDSNLFPAKLAPGWYTPVTAKGVLPLIGMSGIVKNRWRHSSPGFALMPEKNLSRTSAICLHSEPHNRQGCCSSGCKWLRRSLEPGSLVAEPVPFEFAPGFRPSYVHGPEPRSWNWSRRHLEKPRQLFRERLSQLPSLPVRNPFDSYCSRVPLLGKAPTAISISPTVRWRCRR